MILWTLFSNIWCFWLQFLVSKLVDSYFKNSLTQPSDALLLLHDLVVDSDPSLHKHIKVYVLLLRPFPEFDLFFHHDLCQDYDHSLEINMLDLVLKLSPDDSREPQTARLG
ncbi:hypothetical protein LXL04_037342 [Taraxacum kok-saghyz]